MVFLVTFKRVPFECCNAGEQFAPTGEVERFDVVERTSLPAP
jgi:hypothetical protein